VARDRRSAGPMADRESVDDSRTGLPEAPTAADGPASPQQLGGRGWWQAARRTVGQVGEDSLTVWAAALTYYAILSIFPGLLVMVTVLRLTGRHNTATVLRNVEAIAPGPARTILSRALTDLQNGQQSTAGLIAAIGLVGALWSASGYVGSFMRAANAIFDVPEGRPAWKKFPIRLGLTILSGVIVSVAALTVVFTGALARQVGGLIGVGAGAVQVWDVAKWPVLAILIALLFGVLYWAAPNARQGGFRWISPGSLLAVLAWLAASAGFALYVTHFASYNKTYGSLAAVIVFLVWLWISNLAILVGAEFDAELQRQRAIHAGHRADEEPYLPLRDDRKVDAASTTDL
jgi:membrane protein